MASLKLEIIGVRLINCYCNSCELDDLLATTDEHSESVATYVDIDEVTGWKTVVDDYRIYGMETTYYSPDKSTTEIICLSCLLEWKKNETH